MFSTTVINNIEVIAIKDNQRAMNFMRSADSQKTYFAREEFMAALRN